MPASVIQIAQASGGLTSGTVSVSFLNPITPGNHLAILVSDMRINGNISTSQHMTIAGTDYTDVTSDPSFGFKEGFTPGEGIRNYAVVKKSAMDGTFGNCVITSHCAILGSPTGAEAFAGDGGLTLIALEIHGFDPAFSLGLTSFMANESTYSTTYLQDHEDTGDVDSHGQALEEAGEIDALIITTDGSAAGHDGLAIALIRSAVDGNGSQFPTPPYSPSGSTFFPTLTQPASPDGGFVDDILDGNGAQNFTFLTCRSTSAADTVFASWPLSFPVIYLNDSLHPNGFQVLWQLTGFVGLITGTFLSPTPPRYYYIGPYRVAPASPFNLQTFRGAMFRTAIKAGDALMWQSDLPDPSKGWRVSGAAVTELGDVTHARMAFDAKGLLRVVFDHAGNVYEAVSADNGKTYAADALIFPAAKYADITASAGKLSGTILLRSAYAPATKRIGIVEQWGGGTISDEWNPLYLGPFGTEPLQVEDDTFRITSRNGMFRAWYLHVRILGEGHTSGWVSYDYGRSWSRLDGISIAGGTRPTVMAGPRLSEMVWSAYIPADNTIRGIRQFAGAVETFTFTKASGNLLAADGDYHFEQAREGMARYILSVVANGESDVSEWWSKDFAGSWTRI